MAAFLFNPTLFFSILAAMFVVAMFVAFNLLRAEKKFRDMDDQLKREKGAREEMGKNAGSLQEEIERLQKELALKEELYQGLKGQYDELEKDFERSASQPQAADTLQAKSEKPSSRPTVVDLLKSLNKGGEDV